MRTVALWVAVFLAVAAQVSPVYAGWCRMGGDIVWQNGPCQVQKLKQPGAQCCKQYGKWHCPCPKP
jgi:hypothetical protein